MTCWYCRHTLWLGNEAFQVTLQATPSVSHSPKHKQTRSLHLFGIYTSFVWNLHFKMCQTLQDKCKGWTKPSSYLHGLRVTFIHFTVSPETTGSNPQNTSTYNVITLRTGERVTFPSHSRNWRGVEHILLLQLGDSSHWELCRYLNFQRCWSLPLLTLEM